ncbi:MAG: cobalamin-dependent protein, partial [Pseudomonadota bacterium]
MIEQQSIVHKKIILTTLNAKYVHASLGLRYLYANMRDLQDDTVMHEFSINARIADIAESLVLYQPTIIGFGVYIWNVNETLALIRLLRQILDNVVIVLGGPEVSYETEQQEIVKHADYVLCGQADLSFAQLCQQILSGYKPVAKIQSVAV